MPLIGPAELIALALLAFLFLGPGRLINFGRVLSRSVQPLRSPQSSTTAPVPASQSEPPATPRSSVRRSRFCTECGAGSSHSGRFCIHCGTPLMHDG